MRARSSAFLPMLAVAAAMSIPVIVAAQPAVTPTPAVSRAPACTEQDEKTGSVEEAPGCTVSINQEIPSWTRTASKAP